MRLIITGPPAAGKGSLSPFIVKGYNVKHISTGEMFREEIKSGSKLGNEVKKILDDGLLVSDDITNKIVESRLSKDDVKDGFLLDGYPRTLNQAVFLDQLLQSKGLNIDHVIFLEVEEDIMIRRIVGRRICPECGRNYNVYYTKPRVQNICDDDGSTLVKRADDTVETAKLRIKVFHEQTAPILSYYTGKGLLRIANGNYNHSDETFEEVKKILGEPK